LKSIENSLSQARVIVSYKNWTEVGVAWLVKIRQNEKEASGFLFFYLLKKKPETIS